MRPDGSKHYTSDPFGFLLLFSSLHASVVERVDDSAASVPCDLASVQMLWCKFILKSCDEGDVKDLALKELSVFFF